MLGVSHWPCVFDIIAGENRKRWSDIESSREKKNVDEPRSSRQHIDIPKNKDWNFKALHRLRSDFMIFSRLFMSWLEHIPGKPGYMFIQCILACNLTRLTKLTRMFVLLRLCEVTGMTTVQPDCPDSLHSLGRLDRPDCRKWSDWLRIEQPD